MRFVRVALAAGFLALGLGGMAAARPVPALASCAILPGVDPFADAQLVFLGTVTAIENNGRTAKVTVEEVWRGPEIPAEVIVHGGPDDPGMATSVDRSFIAGTKYLFAVSIDEAGTITDNACSGTAEASSVDLDGLRPEDARTPTAAEGDGETPFDPGALVGPGIIAALIGLVAVTVVLANRRREA